MKIDWKTLQFCSEKKQMFLLYTKNRNKYYNGFVRKYGLDKIVENDLNSNICAFDYYDLIDKPYDTLTFIAKFFFGNKFSDTQLDSFISDYQNRIKVRNSLDNGIYQYIKKELNIFYSRGSRN